MEYGPVEAPEPEPIGRGQLWNSCTSYHSSCIRLKWNKSLARDARPARSHWALLIIVLPAIMIGPVASYSEERKSNDDRVLLPLRLAVYDKYGYFDTYKRGYIDKSGRVVIEPQFRWAERFREGLAAVRILDKHQSESGEGFIDKTGNLVIKAKWDSVAYFSEGLAGVRRGKKMGYIDKTGKLISGLRFDQVRAFHEGLACVAIGGDESKDGAGAKWGFIDKSGRWVIEPKFDWAGSFSEGLAAVGIGDHCWYIDKEAKRLSLIHI